MIWDTSLWNWASPAWLVAASGFVFYLLAALHPKRGSLLLFGGAMALLVLAFVSPIGVLADGYLFSAHMVQHLLLLLIVPLLLLKSLPEATIAKWIGKPQSPALPILGWICGVGAMWLWHVPSLCNAATQSPLLGVARDASLVAAGLLFWWPIYAPCERCRMEPLSGMVYLFSACLGCTLLGIYITFTSILVCPAFANPVDRIGIVNQLYNLGFTPSVDQQLGGLLMWVPPCLMYVVAIMGLLSRWYADSPRTIPSQPVRVGE